MEPEEILTLEEIKAKYPNEWVLVVNPVVDEHLNVKSGQVSFHSADRDEVDRKALELRPKSSAFIYTGKAPEGMAFAL